MLTLAPRGTSFFETGCCFGTRCWRRCCGCSRQPFCEPPVSAVSSRATCSALQPPRLSRPSLKSSSPPPLEFRLPTCCSCTSGFCSSRLFPFLFSHSSSAAVLRSVSSPTTCGSLVHRRRMKPRGALSRKSGTERLSGERGTPLKEQMLASS